jgi:hypothetical protein
MSESLSSQSPEVHRPLVSLLSKSEKSLLRLAPESWQHSMIQRNIGALRLAIALMSEEGSGLGEVSPSDLQEAADTFAAMIERVEKTQAKFQVGSSHHSLQKNRLHALKIARMVAIAKGKPGQAEQSLAAESR